MNDGDGSFTANDDVVVEVIDQRKMELFFFSVNCLKCFCFSSDVNPARKTEERSYTNNQSIH